MPVRPLYRNVTLSVLAIALLGGTMISGVPNYVLNSVQAWRADEQRTPESVLRHQRAIEGPRIFSLTLQAWLGCARCASSDS